MCEGDNVRENMVQEGFQHLAASSPCIEGRTKTRCVYYRLSDTNLAPSGRRTFGLNHVANVCVSAEKA